MGAKTLLRCLIIVGGNDQNGVRTGLLGVNAQFNGMGGVVAACAGNDRNPFGDLFYRKTNDRFMFLIRHGRRFAGRAAYDDRVRMILNVEL